MSRRQSDNTNGLKFGLLAGDSQITKTLTQCHLERGGADSAGVALGGGENERRAGGAADAGDRAGAGGYVRIPEHPAGHSDHIRPPKPGYPATLV